MSEIVSRVYYPEKCCEACVFGRGPHAEWCRFRHCPECGVTVTKSMCPEFPADRSCERSGAD
jgi:hypothetical protein